MEIESVITGEQMMLSVSTTQTTLYDEIKYSGSPSDFAWVLPIRGTVTVGVSADLMFATVNALTTTIVRAPTSICKPKGFGGSAGTGGSAGSGGAGGGGGGGVTILGQQQVGPYETVQLASSDGSALTNWLKKNGYNIPKADKTVVDAYVKDGFNFLALKLVPGVGVQAMQPVRVTSTGASVSLPLHMVAVGTGPTTGITIWVVADGRWEPKNFPSFTIQDKDLIWYWGSESSNYESLRITEAAKFKGTGWLIESSLNLAQSTIQNDLENAVQNAVLTGKPGTYLVTAGEGGVEAGSGSGASEDSSAGASEDSSGYYSGYDAGESGAEQVAAADADLAVLFAGITGPNVRITRMRSDISHAALSVDMILAASKDQSELSNIHIPEQQVCPGDTGPADSGPDGSSGDSVPEGGGTDSGHGGAPGTGGTPGSDGSSGSGGGYGYGGAQGSGGAQGAGGSGNLVPQEVGGSGDSGCSTTGASEADGANVGSMLLILGFVGSRVFAARRRSRPAGKS